MHRRLISCRLQRAGRAHYSPLRSEIKAPAISNDRRKYAIERTHARAAREPEGGREGGGGGERKEPGKIGERRGLRESILSTSFRKRCLRNELLTPAEFLRKNFPGYCVPPGNWVLPALSPRRGFSENGAFVRARGPRPRQRQRAREPARPERENHPFQLFRASEPGRQDG